jgi:hypothetical protein
MRVGVLQEAPLLIMLPGRVEPPCAGPLDARLQRHDRDAATGKRRLVAVALGDAPAEQVPEPRQESVDADLATLRPARCVPAPPVAHRFDIRLRHVGEWPLFEPDRRPVRRRDGRASR